MSISVSSGLLVGLSMPLILFVIEYLIERSAMRSAKLKGAKIWWTLTPQRKVRNFVTGLVEAKLEEVDFDPRHGHYMKCGEVVIALASASLVFIPSLHFTAVLPWLGFPMVLLGFTVVYSLSFMGVLTYFYEMQLQNPDTFTAVRSSLIFGLGFSGLGCFAIAYFTLSLLIGNALSNGTLVGISH